MRPPMIIAERDLAGATLESLVRALLRPLLPRRKAKKAVARDKDTVEKPMTDKPSGHVKPSLISPFEIDDKSAA